MIDGRVNKRSGILVINLPSTNCTHFTAPHTEEKELIHPETTSWTSVKTRTEYVDRYPFLPDRIIDNLLEPKAKISVVSWEKLTLERLRFLIEAAFQARLTNEYDMSRAMRRNDYNPSV
jgi:acetylglutamate synthase